MLMTGLEPAVSALQVLHISNYVTRALENQRGVEPLYDGLQSSAYIRSATGS